MIARLNNSLLGRSAHWLFAPIESSRIWWYLALGAGALALACFIDVAAIRPHWELNDPLSIKELLGAVKDGGLGGIREEAQYRGVFGIAGWLISRKLLKSQVDLLGAFLIVATIVWIIAHLDDPTFSLWHLGDLLVASVLYVKLWRSPDIWQEGRIRPQPGWAMAQALFAHPTWNAVYISAIWGLSHWL